MLWTEVTDLEGGYGEVGAESEHGEDPIMVCSTGLDLLQSSCEFPCAICRIGLGSNSIMYNGRMHWVYNKWKGLKHLLEDPNYRYSGCQSPARAIDRRPPEEV